MSLSALRIEESGRTFLIPMRGSEFLPLVILLLGVTFLIPMRGSELKFMAIFITLAGMFLIPMRGSEDVGATLDSSDGPQVPDPHEG